MTSSQNILDDYNFNLGEIEDHIMQVVPQQSAELNQDFNDTYGTKFSGAQVLEEMELDFEANPQPFSGYDGHKSEDPDDDISDSFENIFDAEDKIKQNLINMQIENQKQRNEMKAILRSHESDHNIRIECDSSQEIDMKIVGEKTGSSGF